MCQSMCATFERVVYPIEPRGVLTSRVFLFKMLMSMDNNGYCNPMQI